MNEAPAIACALDAPARIASGSSYLVLTCSPAAFPSLTSVFPVTLWLNTPNQKNIEIAKRTQIFNASCFR